jgi:thiamine biosynthesis protein ThiS
MQITVNGKPREIERGATVASLLEALGLEPRGLAVERNLELVPRAKHAQTALAPGDRLEVVTLVGGG